MPQQVLDIIAATVLYFKEIIQRVESEFELLPLLELAAATLADGVRESDREAPKSAEIRTERIHSAETKKEVTAKPPEAAPVKTAEEKPKVSEPSAEKSRGEEEYNLDEIWHSIFRKAEKVRPSFNLIKTGSTLAEIGKDSFKILVRTEFIKNIIEKDSRLIAELMEEEIGKKLRPVCRLEGAEPDEDEAEEKAREIAEEVREKLHIDNVTIE